MSESSHVHNFERQMSLLGEPDQISCACGEILVLQEKPRLNNDNQKEATHGEKTSKKTSETNAKTKEKT